MGRGPPSARYSRSTCRAHAIARRCSIIRNFTNTGRKCCISSLNMIMGRNPRRHEQQSRSQMRPDNRERRQAAKLLAGAAKLAAGITPAIKLAGNDARLPQKVPRIAGFQGGVMRYRLLCCAVLPTIVLATPAAAAEGDPI